MRALPVGGLGEESGVESHISEARPFGRLRAGCGAPGYELGKKPRMTSERATAGSFDGLRTGSSTPLRVAQDDNIGGRAARVREEHFGVHNWGVGPCCIKQLRHPRRDEDGTCVVLAMG